MDLGLNSFIFVLQVCYYYSLNAHGPCRIDSQDCDPTMAAFTWINARCHPALFTLNMCLQRQKHSVQHIKTIKRVIITNSSTKMKKFKPKSLNSAKLSSQENKHVQPWRVPRRKRKSTCVLVT